MPKQELTRTQIKAVMDKVRPLLREAIQTGDLQAVKRILGTHGGALSKEEKQKIIEEAERLIAAYAEIRRKDR